MPTNWPIRRYLLALVLAIAAPTVTLWVYSLHSTVRSEAAEAGSRTLTLAQIAAADAHRLIQDSGALLAGLALRPKVQALDQADCDGILVDFRHFLPQFANIAIVNQDGTVVCSALPQHGGKLASVADAAWFKEVAQKNRYIAGHPHIGPISGKWVAVLAYPIQNSVGQFVGAIGLPVDLARYQLLPRNAVLPPGTVLRIIEADGTIVASSEAPQRWIGKPFPEPNVVARVKQEGHGQMRLTTQTGSNIYGFVPVDGADWFVVSSVPSSTLLDHVIASAAGSGGLLLLLILLAGVLAYHLGRRIVLPVIAIARTAKAVAAGDVNRRAPVAGPLEIANVARQFNTMLDVRLRTEQKYLNLLESATDAIVITDASRRIVFVNAQAERMFGFSSAELAGKPTEMLIPERFRERHAKDSARFTEQPRSLPMDSRGELVALRKDGTEFPVELSLSPLMTDEGLIVSSIIRDISDRKAYEEHLIRLAQYDTLTGLPNRHLLHDRLESAITQANNAGLKIAVIQMDINRFKEVNDMFGHRIGDKVLKAVGERLAAATGEAAMVARLGSDQFIVMENVSSDVEVVQLADTVQRAFDAPLPVETEEVFLTVCASVAAYPDDGRDSETLLKNVNVAMNHAKQAANNKACYTPDMGARAAERLKLENLLRRALPNNELILYYQPQIDVRTGRILGVEALVRWDNPELGLVPPIQFIAIAEETGLIDSFGEWILRTACAQNKTWQDMGLPPLVMTVNISARQFRQRNLAQVVRTALNESKLDSRWLELEITESMLMARPEEAAQTLHQITAMGVAIALDDFGTGYSSLAYLKRFPVRSLKIDRSFVRDVHTDPDDAAIVAAVISLAKSLDLGLVAEGVELIEQLDFLRSLDCDAYQGYFFSKPVPVMQCTSILQAAASRQLHKESTSVDPREDSVDTLSA